MDLSGLNPQQREAAETIEGPMLLLAGAGSGKTRVVTFRAAHMIKNMGIDPRNILAVTFTNKAAKEMRLRVEEMVGAGAAGEMVVSTFHSLCARILRTEIEHLGYKRNFTIYSGGDQQRLIKDVLKDIDGDLKGAADKVQWIISDAKNRLLDPSDFRPKQTDPYSLLAAKVYPEYQSALKAFNALDFDDLILLAVKLFKTNPIVLEKYQDRYKYIMVDEYQDTNAAQYQLISMLAEKYKNLCVVGDDDQSIYGWRGAEPENILDFERGFPGAKVIKLEQNYRSTANILKAANSVIENNKKRKGKNLWTEMEGGRKIHIIKCVDDEDEARFVVSQIREMRHEHSLSYKDFAVLYRVNSQSRAFEEALRYEDVPYVLIGGQQFFDRKEVKDVMAYLRIICNPRDEVSILRVLNYPKRGIGATTVDKIIRHSAASGTPLWSLLKKAVTVDGVGERAANQILTFTDIVDAFRAKFRTGVDLAETCREMISVLGIEDEIMKEAEDPIRGQRRFENVQEVVNAMVSYEGRVKNPSLPGFLEKVSLLDKDEPTNDDKEKKLQSDSVVLMSLHSSKGLEFPHVFLAGFEEGFLPHKKSVEDKVDVDEERRLCYVGITRAQETLTMLQAKERKKYGKMESRYPSRFAEELPEDVYESRDVDEMTITEEQNDKLADDFFASLDDVFR